MSRETRAMQDDDATDPAVLWLLDGEALWTQGRRGGKACADCHGDASGSMKGVAARYPRSLIQRNLINLDQRINLCRTERQKAPALALGEQGAARAQRLRRPAVTRLADRDCCFTKKRGHSSTPVARPSTAARASSTSSCAQCHDDNWGKSLAGNPIPQAHPTGYPLYRLEWQALGSLQRRLRNCMIGVRAEPYAYGAPEYVELEFYLMWRARGMKLETPAVRP